ncbi:MAG: phosphoglycerate dehydrogenase [Bdellovibrionales bacterium]|nr:phosphoglycerate dehydrogenase [Bdellovibrionales bacterium]
MNTESRVAVASRSFSKHPQLRKELLAKYSNVTFNDGGSSLSDARLVEFLQGHDKAIIALEYITDSILSQLPELKRISKIGVGLDKVDLQAMRARNIEFIWTPGVNKRSVAELTLCFMLSVLRQISVADYNVRNGVFSSPTGGCLTGKTVGIIGCGNIGSDLVRLLEPFECTLLVHDIAPNEEFFRSNNLVACTLHHLLKESDIVTVHVPLYDGTVNLLSSNEIALMKPTAILINTARGGIVNEEALYEALHAGKLGGAGIDVFTTEPPGENALLSLPNVVVTPHIGAGTEEAILAMGRAAIEGLDRKAG